MAGGRRWRNHDGGYGVVTKAFHWLIASLITAQFAIGYAMDPGGGRGRGRGRGRGGESGRGRGRGRGGEWDLFGDDALLTVHVVLGVTILVLALARLTWRMTTPLPPWADTLTPGERKLAHWTERLLYLVMFAIPLTGLVLVFSGDDYLVGLHVSAHITCFVAIAAHLGLVLKHQLLDRDHLLRRMV